MPPRCRRSQAHPPWGPASGGEGRCLGGSPHWGPHVCQASVEDSALFRPRPACLRAPQQRQVWARPPGSPGSAGRPRWGSRELPDGDGPHCAPAGVPRAERPSYLGASLQTLHSPPPPTLGVCVLSLLGRLRLVKPAVNSYLLSVSQGLPTQDCLTSSPSGVAGGVGGASSLSGLLASQAFPWATSA